MTIQQFGYKSNLQIAAIAVTKLFFKITHGDRQAFYLVPHSYWSYENSIYFRTKAQCASDTLGKIIFCYKTVSPTMRYDTISFLVLIVISVLPFLTSGPPPILPNFRISYLHFTYSKQNTVSNFSSFIFYTAIRLPPRPALQKKKSEFPISCNAAL